MARRSNRRQFVWARAMGVVGWGTANSTLAEDLLAGVRDRHGDAVLRGATVMGYRGYIRPSPGGVDEIRRIRVGLRVFNSMNQNDRLEGPILDPESDWMGFHQYFIGGGVTAVPVGSSARGTDFAVDGAAARKLSELGMSLGIYADGVGADFQVSENIFVDYDLSVGLKLP